MIDLNDLRVFTSVASLASFSSAAKRLGLPKSSVSRSVERLEAELGVRLLHRTTRAVVLTPPGESLRDSSRVILAKIDETLDHVKGFASSTRGELRVSAGVGFGVLVLSKELPRFLQRHPDVRIWLDLSSDHVDLISGNIDVAIRFGPMPDSTLVATRLGEMRRFLCASPAYLSDRGTPMAIDELAGHDLLEMPGLNGRPRPWSFTRAGITREWEPKVRTCVNEALTIHELVLHGAGVGVSSGFLFRPAQAEGKLVHILPDWSLPPMPVNLVYPSRRELSPVIRAFVSFMREIAGPGGLWLDTPEP